VSEQQHEAAPERAKAPTPQRLVLGRPDDWHVHLRDGAVLARTVADTARSFGRAIVMPNLTPPVVTLADARAYRDRILAASPGNFEPLMTLYLTDRTDAATIREAQASGLVHGVKLYPAGATTNSESGVTDIARVDAALEAMQACGLPLLVHGEVTDPEVDVFDREAVFIERVLVPLVERYPGLRVVLEHITTADAVAFVRAAPERVAATITAHHLLLNRNALFQGGLRPHHYCLPVVKRERHRRALVAAATSGEARFFLGTDSAPHAREDKESACGCAGLYTAPVAMALYAEAFEDAGALERLESFASGFGPRFYGLAPNAGHIALLREPEAVPETLAFGERAVVPHRAGGVTRWRLAPAGEGA
jgi:dihydroorotase